MQNQKPKTCNYRPICTLVSAYTEWYQNRDRKEPNEAAISSFCTCCSFVKKLMARKDLTEQEAVKQVMERFAS
ncbi:MAG: hypothetical protein ACYDG6_06915 [Thermincolia bacterium]